MSGLKNVIPEKLKPKIIDDNDVQSIEVNFQSSGVAVEEPLYTHPGFPVTEPSHCKYKRRREKQTKTYVYIKQQHVVLEYQQIHYQQREHSKWCKLYIYGGIIS